MSISLLPKKPVAPPVPRIVTHNNVTIHSRAPAGSIPPLPVQHPTSSNSISASVRPFGKPLA